MSRTDELAELAREGDQEAASLLMEDMRRRIESVAYKFAKNNPALAEELAADGYYAMAKALKAWNPDRGKFATFAVSCAHHEMCSSLRKRARHQSNINISEIGENSLPPCEEPEEIDLDSLATGTKASAAALKVLKEEVYPTQRQLAIYVLQGMPINDIAAEMNEPVEVVQRNLKTLCQLLATVVRSEMPASEADGLEIPPAGPPTPLLDTLDDTSP